EGDEEDVREGCPQNREEAAALGRRCLRKCKTDEDCISSKKKCLCDGRCGWSCVRPGQSALVCISARLSCFCLWSHHSDH
ncbi:hypothetical protein MRX96_052504, partial [Rhipicephalus microplus]